MKNDIFLKPNYSPSPNTQKLCFGDEGARSPSKPKAKALWRSRVWLRRNEPPYHLLIPRSSAAGRIHFFPISFLVSFLFHLFFFSSFVFVLPVKLNEERPNFIFWGSILKEYDIKGIDCMNKGFLPLHFFAAREGQGRGKGILKKEEIWLPHASFDKPIFNNLVPGEIKTTLKQAFFNNDTSEGKEEMSVDVGSTLPSYHPLKLFSND